MGVYLSSMQCPVCPGQSLETVPAAIGEFYRCPSCLGFFIRYDVIAAASSDRSACLELLDETKALLLPNDRKCPKCFQRLHDGRIKSRGIILTLCPLCRALWTSLNALSRFDEVVSKTLQVQMELAMHGPGPSDAVSSSALLKDRPSYKGVGGDKGVAGMFRSIARTFDRIADGFHGGKAPSAPQPAKAAKEQKSEVKPAKKPLILDVETAVPPAPAAPKPEPLRPSLDIPEFVFPEGTVIEEKPIAPAEPPKQDAPAAPPQTVPPPIFPPQPPEVPEVTEKPIPKEEVAPVAAQAAPEKKSPAPVPLPQPKPTVGFFGKMKAAWGGPPKKVSKPVLPKPALPKTVINPVLPPAPAPTPVPATAPIVAPIPVSVPTPAPIPIPTPIQPPAIATYVPPPVKKKPAGDGIFKKIMSGFKSAMNPTPRKSVPKPVKPIAASGDVQETQPSPVQPLQPRRTPAEDSVAGAFQREKEESTPAPAPVQKKPVPVAKPKPKAEKKPKPPKQPKDVIAFLAPWAIALVSVIASSFRDFGFEVGPATLWGLAGWAIGFMIRLVRLYPGGGFAEGKLQDLAISEAKSKRGKPVTLAGEIVPANDAEPKGIHVFKQGDLRIDLNKNGFWDLIPRLFGLSNPGQLLKGEVILTGWYRGGLLPCFEIQEIHAGKSARKSMVKVLRWTSAATLLVIALIISLALE